MTVDEIKKEIMALPSGKREELMVGLRHEDLAIRKEELRKRVEKNNKYIGKCYKYKVKSKYDRESEVYKYLKVISNRSSNEYRMESLTFTEHPRYRFDFIRSKVPSPENYYLGEFDYTGIVVEDFPYFCYRLGTGQLEIDFLEEITLEEYNKAMNNYIKELQELDWVIDD